MQISVFFLIGWCYSGRAGAMNKDMTIHASMQEDLQVLG